MDNHEDEETDVSAQEDGNVADSQKVEEKSLENRGTLILDATCCPADIHYPTDTGLLSHTWDLVGKSKFLYNVECFWVYFLHKKIIRFSKLAYLFNSSGMSGW